MKPLEPRRVALAVAAWAAVGLGAVVLYFQAAALPEWMPRQELERTARHLRSDALEARALAAALADGQLTKNFALEQHERLADDLRDVRKALDKPPPRDGKADVERLRRSVDQLDALIARVPASLADAEALQRIGADEAAIADAAKAP